jgi:hypothetical protein
MSGESHDVTAAERASPDGDPRGINALERAGIGNRRSPVRQLTTDVQQLARLTIAVAEVAVIEDESRESGLGEALGVCVQALVAYCREAVRQDDARGRTATVFRRPIEPRGAPCTTRLEREIAALHGSPPGVAARPLLPTQSNQVAELTL